MLRFDRTPCVYLSWANANIWEIGKEISTAVAPGRNLRAILLGFEIPENFNESSWEMLLNHLFFITMPSSDWMDIGQFL
jgi:hypothetical protein